ncbi:hypothetical protein [Chlamydia vaughanii]|uniref:hypothetical protein n=1 Tax=Chlamydia vaughanii TaxID=3112552 RepID=UPI0032B12AD5
MSVSQTSTQQTPVKTQRPRNTCASWIRTEKFRVGLILGITCILLLSGILVGIFVPSQIFTIVLILLLCLATAIILLDFVKTQPHFKISPPALDKVSPPSVEDPQPTQINIPKYQDLLKMHWRAARWRNLPHNIRPLPDSIQNAAWRLTDNPNITLISTVGDITVPLTTSECTLMMINPYSPEHLSCGDNPFIDAVSSECWKNAKQTHDTGHIFHPGACSVKCLWESSQGIQSTANSGWPYWFAHVYSPKAAYLNPETAFTLCKITYTKCFEEAVSGSNPATMIQMPLLFSGSTGLDESCPFLDASKSALVSALQDFSTQHPNTSLTIVIAREVGMALEQNFYEE